MFRSGLLRGLYSSKKLINKVCFEKGGKKINKKSKNILDGKLEQNKNADLRHTRWGWSMSLPFNATEEKS